MIKGLNEIAVSKARKTISSTFSSISSMDEAEISQKQLAAAESQLNGAVQSKLDSIKRAVDLMDESSVSLQKLALSMNRVDEKIEYTNTAISKYENLKRVHNARENLQKVIAQVEFFARVPEKVDQLKKLLDDEKDGLFHLKEVYLESLKLESLRVALMKEIRVSRHRKRSMSNLNAVHAQGDYSQDAFNKIREAVEKHLLIVPELVKAVRSRVFDCIERMWDLAVNTPANLVCAFEIVEMQQEYNTRRDKDREKGDKPLENIRSTVKDKIRLLLETKVEGEFEALNHYADNEKMSRLAAVIIAANQMFQKLSLFKEEVVPCMPPTYEPMQMFIEAFESQLLPRVDIIMKDISSLKVAELLDLINWIEYHKTCYDNYGFVERPCINDFANTKNDLLLEYKDRIKKQVNEWFENIKKQDLEIQKASDDTLVTSNPEDMFNIIHAQLEVAREKLPLEYTKEVAIAMLQVLQEVQRQSYDTLSKNWRTMDPEAMCATINDNQRMQEKCDEFGEHLIRFVEDEEEKELLRAVLEEVSNEYITLAVNTINFLARCMLEDLDEPVFSRLFSPEWETGEDLAEVLVATLKDYFQDLSRWLSTYFYSKLVRETMVTIVTNYVMVVRKRANGMYSFSSEIVAANRIINDETTIENYFEANMDMLIMGGLKSKGANAKNGKNSENKDSALTALRLELEPMLNLARVVSARHFSGAEGDCKSFFEKWSLDGLRVVQAAFQLNPSLNKQDKIQHVESAKKLYDNGNYPQNKFLEEFVGFDPPTSLGIIIQQKGGADNAGNNKSNISNFWGRKKK